MNEKLQKANLRLFQDRYYSNPKHIAQDALIGLTHYVDDETLKFFKSKILEARPIFDGALFLIIESKSTDWEHRNRAFFPVVFDVFGDVIYRMDLEDGFKNKQKSLDAFKKWQSEFDLQGYYNERLNREIQQLKRETEKLELALV
jgi:hypothetical protein